jgi:hypothetical protein
MGRTEAKAYLIENKPVGKCQEGTNQCAGSHAVSPGTRGPKLRLSGKKGETDGLNLPQAFKRPAPAVWGNGLWGSVGGAGRSYD